MKIEEDDNMKHSVVILTKKQAFFAAKQENEGIDLADLL